MSEPIRNTESAVRQRGALPVPIGGETDLTPEQRATIAQQLGDVKPATAGLLISFGESVRARREHDHPKWEDLFCMNLSSYMGERMAPVLRRLLDLEDEVERLRLRTAYRAWRGAIALGTYDSAETARQHCEAVIRRDLPTVSLDWIEDEEDQVAELVASVGEDERVTGFVVTALEIASEYNAEADE
ncbi:hypothetical protein [Streptomyces sp. NPDC002952]|uniref:hypothetical protein n=1 Tax=Streptomyces sp. NPDC002952 TaxID=3364673 RepID=UPI0036B866B5